jgi:outer membrane protein OmpA-like peptidoglycan-associated protein
VAARYARRVRSTTITLATFVLLALLRVAAAEPVSFALQGQVGAGQKPQLMVTASEKITDLRLELLRADGKKFSGRHAGLDKDETVSLPIGDGAVGKASYKGTLSMAVAGGKRWTEQLTFDTVVGGGSLKVTYDAEHLDLDKRVLQFKPTHPVASATLTVIGDDGKELGTGSATYKDAKGDEWQSITWTQPAKTTVMIMQLRVVATDGGASNLELIPWSVTIDHEDVNFTIDSSKIDATEALKLDVSLSAIAGVVKRSEKLMKMQLYIAGHTDTVGPNAKNRKLSLDRARAIATYFRKKGLKLPIAFAGFGEEVLKVKTPDNTDERANRRVDYVIGPAAGAPPFKGAYSKVKADWKQLK